MLKWHGPILAEFLENQLIAKKDFAAVIYNELITKLLENKKIESGQLLRSQSLLPQGGSAKNILMFFYLKEGPGKEPEVGQQEQKHPFELIFGKINHHSTEYILNVVLK